MRSSRIYRAMVLGVAGMLVLSLASCRFLPGQGTDVPSVTKRFQKVLDRHRKDDKFPGATAAFILPDGQVVGVATGYSDREARRAMGADSLQPVGDVGESFFGTGRFVA